MELVSNVDNSLAEIEAARANCLAPRREPHKKRALFYIIAYKIS